MKTRSLFIIMFVCSLILFLGVACGGEVETPGMDTSEEEPAEGSEELELTRIAEETRAAETRAVEEIRAAETRAVEEIRAAQTRAVEETRAAEIRSVEEIRAAQTRAAEETRVSETRAVEEIRAAETRAAEETVGAEDAWAGVRDCADDFGGVPVLQHIPEVINKQSGSRLFWTIVVDACRNPDMAPQIAVRKIFHVYTFGLNADTDQPEATESLEPWVEELPYQAVCPTGSAIAVDAEIDFGPGCYLELTDRGLLLQAGDKGIGVPAGFSISEAIEGAVATENEQPPAGGVASGEFELDNGQFRRINGVTYYAGENIRLDVIFAVEEIGDHPLFFHPQFFPIDEDDEVEIIEGMVAAAERITDDPATAPNSAVWQVNSAGYIEGPYPLGSYESQRYLLTRQRQHDPFTDAYDPNAYFQFRLQPEWDAAGVELFEGYRVPGDVDDNDTHLFSTDQVTIYVGLIPDTAEFGDSTLNGSLSSIVFDPNSSCWSC